MAEIVNLNGSDIRFEIHGEGIPIVYTPGGFWPLERGRAVAERLKSFGYKVLLWDRPNTGESGLFFERENLLRIWADQLHQLLHYTRHSPAFISGGSGGYLAALYFAYVYPTEVKGLILISPPTDNKEILQSITKGTFLERAEAAEQYGISAAIEDPGSMWDFFDWHDQFQRRPHKKQQLLALDPLLFARTMRAWAHSLMGSGRAHFAGLTDEQLATINIPAIVFSGLDGADGLHPQHTAEALHARLSKSELVITREYYAESWNKCSARAKSKVMRRLWAAWMSSYDQFCRIHNGLVLGRQIDLIRANKEDKMKKQNLSMLIFMILLAACAQQSGATPRPIPLITNTALATATPKPTQTLEPTFTPVITNTPIASPTPGPTHTPVAGFPLEYCPNLKEAKVSNTGILEVTYDYRSRKLSGGDGPSDIPTPPPWLDIQFSNLMLDTQFWVWSEDTQATVSITVPANAKGPEISTDHHWILFRRDFGEIRSSGYFIGIIKSELWVMDINGQNERKLAAISINEVKARNPNILYASLGYGWVPRTDKIYYKVELASEGGDTTDAFMLVDIHSGAAISLAQPGKAPHIVFAPDGSQAAVLTTNELPQIEAGNYGSQPAALINGGELQLVNTKDASVQFTLPIQIQDNFLEYSPDGKYVIGLSEEGMVVMNTRDGKWQKIPLSFKAASGELPEFTWVDNSTLLVPISNLPNPDANFTIWRVTLNDASAQPVQTFLGDTNWVEFSPDGNYLTFQKTEKQAEAPNGKYATFLKPTVTLGGGQPPNLSLADLKTGNIFASLEAIYLLSWSPDSNYYIYGQYEPVNQSYGVHFYLGQIGAEPIPLVNTKDYPPFHYANWVDAERFVWDAECVIRLFSFGTTVQEQIIIP